jgi:hypothetical protein
MKSPSRPSPVSPSRRPKEAMLSLVSDRLVAIWEQGVWRHPIDRALLLFALAEPDTPSSQLADLPLSHRNVALMALYQAIFGPHLAAWVDCEACSERMEFTADTANLSHTPADESDLIEVKGLRFHRPTSRHLARLAQAKSPEAAAHLLLRECAESPDALPQEEEALGALLDAVEASMEAADPWADITVGVRCPACDHEAAAAFDIASILWEEIDSRAQRVLDDVHILARSYGWSEPEVLALSETRRAAYLARVQS